ncbi:EAL domain-containing protein [Devosia rhodophyticola]|uniref:EAL domain-containing protein n=1 Tax=Devosia rhodophyticola TaxID=3026423 RepID=A0ABY7YUR4_9HYPH|nr:bifunctional diguanylate cyclase/phosphodiesterase [Devosia rhodophyticola]WDR04996.1 EAL domain-containing protein [Devosia rhodophyticola]
MTIDNLIDRAIGAEDLKPHVRARLLEEQMASLWVILPIVVCASTLVSAIFVIVCRDSMAFAPILTWAAIIWLFNIPILHVYLARRGNIDELDADSAQRISRAVVVVSVLCGALWGIGFHILPIAEYVQIRQIATVGIGGILFVGLVALINYPQALIGFVTMILAGALFARPQLEAIDDFWLRGILLLSLVGCTILICLRHARHFVEHRGSLNQVQEKGEIIGLLLREFESTASNWIWGFDKDGGIDRLSVGFSAATGVSESDLLGADFLHFLRCITPENDPFMAQIEMDCKERATFQDVELQVLASGHECWWSLTGKPVFDHAQNYLGYIGTVADISARKAAEQRITRLAHHDVMTGLLNRTRFTEHLNNCVARLERYGAPFSVLFLDLDQFKSVNDSRGHMVGDKLLAAVAHRITAAARDTDIVARLGGDEFAIILPNDCSPEGNASLAQRLINSINQTFQIEDEEVNIGISVGIAMAPINGTRPDQILRNADLALYRAKADGRSVFRFFESQMDSDARERRMLEVELRDALKNKELELYYQPLISAVDRRPMGFEALIRWNHPIRGLVPPAEFIPLAERSSLIVEIGDWTIEQACRAAASWPTGMTVAVNMSAKHFRLSDIAQVVKKALANSGLESNRLEIEITEGLLMENPEEVTIKLAEIRDLGVTLAMDDFGTGYSSLSYLLKFPFDKIKIDKSFIDASSQDPAARDILKAIASLGKTLNLRITAEGVETAEQADFLSTIACHQLQGFHFSPPLDSIDMPRYLLANVPTREAEVRAEVESVLMARRAG